MYNWSTIADTVVYDTTLGDVFGLYGALAFLAIAGALFGVTLAILVRGVLEQMRAPEATRARVVDAAHADDHADPAPVSAG